MRRLENKFQSQKQRAFTLLEVLIAMAIFATAAVGLIKNVADYQAAQVTSIQRTVAHWVAMNQVARMRLEKKWPNLGVTRGSSEMAGKLWYWIQTVSKTTEKQLRQVKVEVRLEESDQNATVSAAAFIANRGLRK